MKFALATLVALTSCTAPVTAGEYQAGYSSTNTCYRTEYREEYIPGSENNPGYVKSWKDTIDCCVGKIAGPLLGGAAGAAMSRGAGRWWAIPIGAVVGSGIGCDIDGG